MNNGQGPKTYNDMYQAYVNHALYIRMLSNVGASKFMVQLFMSGAVTYRNIQNGAYTDSNFENNFGGTTLISGGDIQPQY